MCSTPRLCYPEHQPLVLGTREPRSDVSGLGPRLDEDLFLCRSNTTGLIGSFAYGGWDIDRSRPRLAGTCNESRGPRQVWVCDN